MINVKISSTPVRNPHIVFRQEFDEWAVLFDPENGTAYAINPISAFIWKNLDGSHSIMDLEKMFRSEFEEVPDSVQVDIVTFIKDMIEKGFVNIDE